jgi:hypothetical protein
MKAELHLLIELLAALQTTPDAERIEITLTDEAVGEMAIYAYRIPDEQLKRWALGELVGLMGDDA